MIIINILKEAHKRFNNETIKKAYSCRITAARLMDVDEISVHAWLAKRSDWLMAGI